MKKILALVALALSSAAFAGGSGVTMEYEYENGQKGASDSNSISVAPYIKFGDNWKADVKFEGSRDTGKVNGNEKPLDGLIEARIRKDIEVVSNLYAGLRLGVGEKINGENTAGKTVDFTFYTVEPILTYKATDALSFNTSYRYRNAFNPGNYHYSTDTYKVGAAYKFTKEDEVGVKYFEKYGDMRSNGVELVYNRGF